jgi:hypothetical protein
MPLQGVRVVNSDNMTILGFDDVWKSQITYTKPILDKIALMLASLLYVVMLE